MIKKEIINIDNFYNVLNQNEKHFYKVSYEVLFQFVSLISIGLCLLVELLDCKKVKLKAWIALYNVIMQFGCQIIQLQRVLLSTVERV